MPTHYEPMESPLKNALYPRQTNPGLQWFSRPDNRFSPPEDPRFPFVMTTYRLTEHHTTGAMSRFLPHLNELQPELFVEISVELAAELGVLNGDFVIVATLRGALEARALVSRRMRPLMVDGNRRVHQIAIPYHWGYAGPKNARWHRQRPACHQRRAQRHHHGIQGPRLHDHPWADASGRSGPRTHRENFAAR